MLAAVVALSCLVAADVGLQVAHEFAPTPVPAKDRPGMPVVGQAADGMVNRRDSGVVPPGPEPRGAEAKTLSMADVSTVVQGISAALVAMLTVGLLKVASRQASVTGRQADIAMRQADISDRQLCLTEVLERPVVLLARLGWCIEGWKSQESRTRFPDVEVELANFGRGVAVVRHCRVAILVGVSPPVRLPFGESGYSALMVDGRGKRSPVTYTNYYRGSRRSPSRGRCL